MATQLEADKTLTYYQEKLLKNKNISYIAVVPQLDAHDQPTGKFILEAGVYDLTVQANAVLFFKNKPHKIWDFVPEKLKITTELSPVVFSSDYIEVRIRQSKKFVSLAYPNRMRPASGGSSVGNFNTGGSGTLGATLRIKKNKGLYFISNWHVLAGTRSSVGDSILQPSVYNGGTDPYDAIGTLYWSNINARMDAALALVTDRSQVAEGTICFGPISGTIAAAVMMKVRKCGMATGATYGLIHSTNATLNVDYPGTTRTFIHQILSTNMAQRGDSGSLLLYDNLAVGLLFAGDESTFTAYNHILDIFGDHSWRFFLTKSDIPPFELDKFGI